MRIAKDLTAEPERGLTSEPECGPDLDPKAMYVFLALMRQTVLL